ncbi:MAG: hypothetical protein ABW067_17400 [Rhizobacter sp.]
MKKPVRLYFVLGVLALVALWLAGCGSNPPSTPAPVVVETAEPPSFAPSAWTATSIAPAPSGSPLRPRVRGGAICGSPGKEGVSRDTGKVLVCRRATDGRDRWQNP